MITPRTDHLGAAVRQARYHATRAAPARPPMTTSRLAKRLPHGRGLRAKFPNLQDCVWALDDIEAGCPWPFDPGEEQDFIRDCARALCSGNSATEQNLIYEFSDAVAKDLFPPPFP